MKGARTFFFWPSIVPAAILLALVDPGKAQQTNGAELAPEEAFAPASAPAVPESTFVASPAPADSTAPVDNGGGEREPFSLGDFFAQFFELRPPGDPNHPDKLRLTIGTSVGYDTNVFTTHTDPIASGTAGVNGNISYNFGSERLKLSSTLGGEITYYDNRPGDPTDFTGNFNAAMSYFLTRRLQISVDGGAFYASQPNPTLIGGISRFTGDYSGTNLNVSVSYSLRPRLSARLEFHQNTITYADEGQNESLGFIDRSYVFGFDYLFTPRITLTTEYRYNPLTYYEADQDSIGQIFTVGFIASISPRLRWTLQGGAEARSFDSSQTSSGSPYLGPFLESDVEYDFAPGSALVGTMRYGTEPSGFAGLAIRETLRGSLGLNYAFTPRLSGNVGLTYEHDHYDQPGDAGDSSQEYYTAGVGLGFQVNPSLLLTLRFDYSALNVDDQSDQNYTRGITSLGLQVIF